MKQYYQDNKEKIKKYKEQWRLDNQEHIKQYDKQWNENNPEYQKQYNGQWFKNNKENRREYINEWRKDNPKKQAEIDRRCKSNRRQLGFIPLNKPFENCDGHHISENFIIYIPKKIHRNIKHNIWNWHNMEQMNKLAIELL